MTRFAQLNANPGNLNTRIVQSSDADDLTAKVNAQLTALAAIGTAPVLVTMTLAGAGDGELFMVTIQTAPDADTNEVGPEVPVIVTGGSLVNRVVCYEGAGPGRTVGPTAALDNIMLLERARAITRAGFSGVATLEDEQSAGSANGDKFMGMILGTFTPAP